MWLLDLLLLLLFLPIVQKEVTLWDEGKSLGWTWLACGFGHPESYPVGPCLVRDVLP